MNAANSTSLEDPTVQAASQPHVAESAAPAEAVAPLQVEYSPADRFMRRLLRVDKQPVDRSARTEREAHRSFRTSMIVSGIRCIVAYLLIPILVPVMGFAGVLAAPIGIALCLVAYATGIYSLRKFWGSNHRSRWMYTGFIAVVFVILTIMIAADISRMVGGA